MERFWFVEQHSCWYWWSANATDVGLHKRHCVEEVITKCQQVYDINDTVCIGVKARVEIGIRIVSQPCAPELKEVRRVDDSIPVCIAKEPEEVIGFGITKDQVSASDSVSVTIDGDAIVGSDLVSEDSELVVSIDERSAVGDKRTGIEGQCDDRNACAVVNRWRDIDGASIVASSNQLERISSQSHDVVKRNHNFVDDGSIDCGVVKDNCWCGSGLRDFEDRKSRQGNVSSVQNRINVDRDLSI